MSIGELRRIISDLIREDVEEEPALPPAAKPTKPMGLPKKKRVKHDTTDKRVVIDKVREAISNAATDMLADKVRSNVGADILKYSEIEIISEPPKTLVRFKSIDGNPDKDMIYLVNVTKIV